MKCRKIAAIFLALLLAMQCCDRAEGAGKAAKLKVTSSAFDEGEMIPEKHAFNYENASPPIAWSKVPDGTKSIALICDDPDAPRGEWVHWVIFNIPPVQEGLPEGVPKEEVLSDGSAQGINDFKNPGYDGPTPPYGTHRYVFKVFALDIYLDLEAGATKKEVLGAMAGHILAEGQLKGKFKKKIDIPAEPMI